MLLRSFVTIATAAAAVLGAFTPQESPSSHNGRQPSLDVDAPKARRLPGEPAPFLVPSGHEEKIVPGSYLVGLYKDYTLGEHFRFIGANLTTSNWCDEFQYFASVGNVYHIKTKNETLIHKAIRMDPGVEYVEADVMWTLPDTSDGTGGSGWGLGEP